jgi:sporulation protein YlmC with PRC-barrel domain
MSLIHRSWRPGRGHGAEARLPSGVASALQEARTRRLRENAAARALHGSLISLAALIGGEVRDSDGRSAGRLRDVVVHWTSATTYPPVTAIVVRSGGEDVVIGARWVELAAPGSVRLRSTAAYARGLERHPGDVALAHDVLDRQVVDTDGTQLVRPADIYLVAREDLTELAGVEVGVGALIRRIGPRRLRSRFRPERVIDWATIRSFASARDDGSGRGTRAKLAGQTGSGLALTVSASELRRMRAAEVAAAVQSRSGSGDGSR